MLNTEKSSLLYSLACDVIPSGVSSSMRKNVKPMLYFDRGEGPYFIDVDGNKYIDYTLAWGPLIAGSNCQTINDAVSHQLTKSYTFGAQHELEITLSEDLVKVLPGVDQILFANTGSEAIQSAIRIARAYTGRDKILKFEGHYHGWNNNILVSYKPSAEQLGSPTPTCGGQPESEYSDTIVLPWNDIEAVRDLLKRRGHEIACVLTEPIMANSGSCMPTSNYLQEIVALCEEFDVISIFDEVITGFRLGLGGARDYFNVRPDLSVYAKAIAGGFTLAAIGGKRKFFDVIRNGVTIHAGTYNGSSINLAAAKATLSVLREENCFQKMHELGNQIRETISVESRKANIPVVISGVGTVFSVHFGLYRQPLSYADVIRSDSRTYQKFRMEMCKRGVLLLPDGRWYIGASHSANEVDKTKESIKESFQMLKKSY